MVATHTSGIDVIAYLLQMDSKALQNALRIKTLSMGNKGEEVKKPLTIPEVRAPHSRPARSTPPNALASA
jgi:hypothetical protein